MYLSNLRTMTTAFDFVTHWSLKPLAISEYWLSLPTSELRGPTTDASDVFVQDAVNSASETITGYVKGCGLTTPQNRIIPVDNSTGESLPFCEEYLYKTCAEELLEPTFLAKRMLAVVGPWLSTQAKARPGGVKVKGLFPLRSLYATFEMDIWIGCTASGEERLLRWHGPRLQKDLILSGELDGG